MNTAWTSPATAPAPTPTLQPHSAWWGGKPGAQTLPHPPQAAASAGTATMAWGGFQSFDFTGWGPRPMTQMPFPLHARPASAASHALTVAGVRLGGGPAPGPDGTPSPEPDLQSHPSRVLAHLAITLPLPEPLAGDCTIPLPPTQPGVQVHRVVCQLSDGTLMQFSPSMGGKSPAFPLQAPRRRASAGATPPDSAPLDHVNWSTASAMVGDGHTRHPAGGTPPPSTPSTWSQAIPPRMARREGGVKRPPPAAPTHLATGKPASAWLGVALRPATTPLQSIMGGAAPPSKRPRRQRAELSVSFSETCDSPSSATL